MELLAVAALLGAFLIAAELALRRLGFGSFPLYERTPGSVYRMHPTQAGSFMNRYRWRYDANGMRNEEVPADFSGVTLLIGDSVVDGGLRIGQDETLAAVASRLSGDRYYCVACHGWALVNAIAAVRDVPGWDRAQRLVFVLNPGDFDLIGELRNELSFPTRKPWWLTGWMAARVVYRRIRGYLDIRELANNYAAGTPYRDELLRTANLREFKVLVASFPGAVDVVRYPVLGEDAKLDPFCEDLAALDGRIRLFEVGDVPGWSANCYADNVHPSAHGIALLASHLCVRLR